MADHDSNALVTQGIAAYNAGDHSRAHTLFVQALQNDPRHEVGWLWMSAVVQTDAERRYCLERVLEVNPEHGAAQRGIAKFPPELRARSPLPPPPSPMATASHQCSYPGCGKPVARADHMLCYEHWKQTKRPKPDKAPPTSPAHKSPSPPPPSLLTASQIGEQVGLSSQRVNLLLAELGWIEQQGPNWIPSPQGQTLGALQRHFTENGKAYVVWPESILTHKALCAVIQSMRGETSDTHAATTSEQTFRKRFPAQHRTTDGHLVRSKAEMLIDNWLYMAGVVHAYERQLPIEEEVYCDFYLPAGKVYVEYWGIENDPAYNARRKTKVEIYQRSKLQLIELTDDHIRNLDDCLPKMLIKYRITVE